MTKFRSIIRTKNLNSEGQNKEEPFIKVLFYL